MKKIFRLTFDSYLEDKGVGVHRRSSNNNDSKFDLLKSIFYALNHISEGEDVVSQPVECDNNPDTSASSSIEILEEMAVDMICSGDITSKDNDITAGVDDDDSDDADDDEFFFELTILIYSLP